ncbi:HNH endonuclease [Nostoc sp. CHAB 5824]|nr:HNH endonuclease [Nostoc sp. CHAB 5824]
MPVAGKLYSAQTLPLILDFVNIVNNIDFNNRGIDDDTTGEATIQILKKVRKIAYRLNSNHVSSLGLHPIVYFYSKDGRYKTVSFLSIVDLVMELDKIKKVNDFIEVREDFEELVLEYDYLLQQIYVKYRSVQKSYKYISKFLQEAIICLKSKKTIEETIDEVLAVQTFQYLTVRKTIQPTDSSVEDFNTNRKSEIYIKETFKNIPQCKICNGFIHRNSISFDHIQRKADGGLASVDNGQITHPYCNTGYKN